MHRLAPTAKCKRPGAFPQRSRKLYRAPVDFRDQINQKVLLKEKIDIGGQEVLLLAKCSISLFCPLAEREQKEIL